MKFKFNPNEGLIIVRAEIVGSVSTAFLRLALDTGATKTLINTRILATLGYDPGIFEERVEVTIGSGVEYSPVIPIEQIKCLGIARKDMPVLAHTLPPSAGVDGLLGLDFIRSCRLHVDLQKGTIEVIQ